MDVKVTVIVPIYNTEKYLRKCIESILRQTYKSYELLLIDDGSMDESGNICDEYRKRDSRVIVIHKENEGLVAARNTGILNAKGKYVAFVDSDDWVDECHLESMLDLAEVHNADLVAMGCEKFVEGKKIKVLNNIEAGVYEGEKLKTMYGCALWYRGFYKFGVLQYLWNKLFKRDILLNKTLDIDTLIDDGEDVARLFSYLMYCRKVVLGDETTYKYIVRNDSMTAFKRENYFENASRIYIYMYKKFVDSEYKEIMLPQLNQFMRMMIRNGTDMIDWRAMFLDDVFSESYKGKWLDDMEYFPYKDISGGSRVVIYGAGNLGKSFYSQLRETGYCTLVCWVDKNCDREDMKRMGVESVDKIKNLEYDFIVVAVKSKKAIAEIQSTLINMGVNEEKIWARER